VTGSGGGVGISVIKAARLAGYKIIAVDMNPFSAGLLRADKAYLVPEANDSKYISKLCSIAEKEKVDVIIPGCDQELYVLALNREEILRKTGIQVIVGTTKAIRIGRDKYETQNFLKKNKFNYCKTEYAEKSNNLISEFGYPLIVKPQHGSGSIGLFKIQDEDDLKYAIKKIKSMGDIPIIQEYLMPDNQEYTTGVMFSIDRKLLGAITIKRKIKWGNSILMWLENFTNIKSEMVKIGKRLKTQGPLNLQCRLTNKGPVVFEINPRFSGTTAVRAALGFNDVKMIVENFLFGIKPKFAVSKKEVIIIRYFNEVYIDKRGLSRLQKGVLQGYF